MLRHVFFCLSAILVLFSGLPSVYAQQPRLAAPDTSVDSAVLSQITALEQEKASRTPAQQKISSHLLYTARQNRGIAAAAGLPSLRLNTGVVADQAGRVLVDIKANVIPSVLRQIAALGGTVVFASPRDHSIRANMPLQQLEALASRPEIAFIRPAALAELERDTLAASRRRTLRVQLPQFLAQIRFRPAPAAALSAALLRDFTLDAYAGSGAVAETGSVDSQGDVTLEADRARAAFGVTGAGIKVGVLSDSLDDANGSYAAALASGDVSSVTVLPGQDGGQQSGEGLAMLEIVHDLAPDAQLYFASAFNGEASFAQNIRDLRSAGCNIIIDDVFYYDEDPFQDAAVAQAVDDVTADGALYFSAAGNQGSLDDKTSSVWEGDFNDSGVKAVFGTKAGTLHNFAPTGSAIATQNPVSRITSDDLPAVLFWSDPLGASNNDYDLFLINANGKTVADASTDVQNGTQDPIESVTVTGSANGGPSGRRIVIVKTTSAAPRFLHVNLFGNEFAPTTASNIPAYATAGQTHGHSSAAAAFSVAATPAPAAYPSAFNSSDTVETYSSDGPRHVFYMADGTPDTPGSLLSSGGVVRLKPDITAADGVSTTLPSNSSVNLNPFYGTSAAAPHAGAIAALLKQYNPFLTPAQVRAILTGPADIDIMASGYDRDSGYGIVDAYSALASAVRSISGQVTLQGWTGAAQPLTFTLSPTSTPNGGVITQTLTPAVDGTFTLSNLPAGTYTLGIKGSRWLRRDIAVDVSTNNVSGLAVSLMPGDLNGDNAVSLSDLALLRAAYGSTPASANWNPNADLNGDNAVSLSNLAILRANYGKTGDP